MKRFLSFLLSFAFIGSHVLSLPAWADRATSANSIRGVASYKNYLGNGDADKNTRLWSESAGTLTHTATAGEFARGTGGLKWVSSADGDTLSHSSISLSNTELLGNNAVFFCQVKTAESVFSIEVTDGTNTLATNEIQSTSPVELIPGVIEEQPFKYAYVFFTGPSSGSVTARFSASGAGTLYPDDCFLGRAEAFGLGSVEINPPSETKSYTPTVGGVSQAISGSGGAYYLKDDRLYVEGNFRYNVSTGGSTSDVVTVSLPSGFTIDTSKLASSTVSNLGSWRNLNLTTIADSVQNVVMYNGSNTVKFRKGGTSSDYTDADITTGDYIMFNFSVPVVETEQATTQTAIRSSQVIDPIGTIIPVAGECPAGTLDTDGSAVSRTTYAKLFAKIGETHGEGDGSTTFHLPDYRGRFLRGVDDGAGNDPDAASRTAMNTGGATGDNVGSVQGDATARPNSNFGGTTQSAGAHKHNYLRASTAGSSADFLASGSPYAATSSNAIETGGSHQHPFVVTDGGDNETRPKNAYVKFCIVYQGHYNVPMLVGQDKIQTKILTTSVTSDTTVSELGFDNLVIGKWYTLNVSATFRGDGASADAVCEVLITNNGNHIGGVASHSEGNFNDMSKNSQSIKFQAEATSVVMATSSCSNIDLWGDGTKRYTHATIIEHAHGYQETSEF